MTDETRNKTGGSADKGGLADLHALDNYPRDEGGAGSDDRVHQGERRNTISRELRARVEAKPAKPTEA